MALSHDRHFKLKLGIPREFPRKFNDKYCHFADGVEDCECVKKKPQPSIEDCEFYGRPVEPLAFYLPPLRDVNQQMQSRLYTIPKEIRDLIFEYALADDGAPSFNCDNVFRRRAYGTIPSVDCACTLLQTCKAVYLEAYRLPFLLNGYLAYRTKLYYGRHDGSRFDSPSRPNMERIAPWQYALIQRIDMSLQQVSLESRLVTEIELWQPALRYEGAYCSPRYYNSLHSWNSSDPPEVSSHNFKLVPATIENSPYGPEDGNKVQLPRWDMVEFEGPDYDEYNETYTQVCKVMGKFTAAAMVARRLTHLTLRLSRTDWWTWEDDPNTTDNDKQLALDPFLGGRKSRPLLHEMVELANMRRAGYHPAYDDMPPTPASWSLTHPVNSTPWYHEPDNDTWGAAIGIMPDLKTFELVLETFAPKKRQLETVVECARTWKFPLKGTEYELVCDNKVEALQWRLPASEDQNASQKSEDVSEQNEGASEETSEESEYEFSEDDDESWHRSCTEFEVRVVRFKRRKVEWSS
ncbi:unnamed protein product [Periconia digitata]|uniref:Uncharacterized protein n=1 Tax=Periconia digitata TaxID=1303443 RepID=A0A9W4XQX1_9PLEO|nr:unnamed protein product [Periconia digitata]